MGTELSYFDILNQPLEIELGPKESPIKITARKVGSGAVIAHLESCVLSQRIAAARTAAWDLDARAQSAFLIDALRSLPAGKDLQDMALSYFRTVNGRAEAIWCAVRDCGNVPALTRDNVIRLVWDTDSASVVALTDLLCGL